MKLHNLSLPETTQSTPLKLYCDANKQSDGMAYAGWVFADHNGKPIEITGNSLGKGWDTVEAEVESVIRALNGINHYDQVQHVKVYTDCKAAVYDLEDIKLDKMYETVTVDWIPREENQVADIVADGFMVKHWNTPEREVAEP